jgi:hypothetical protein
VRLRAARDSRGKHEALAGQVEEIVECAFRHLDEFRARSACGVLTQRQILDLPDEFGQFFARLLLRRSRDCGD